MSLELMPSCVPSHHLNEISSRVSENLDLKFKRSEK